MQTLRLQEATGQTRSRTLDARTTEWQAAPCAEAHGAQGGLQKGRVTGQARPAFTERGLPALRLKEREGIRGALGMGNRGARCTWPLPSCPPCGVAGDAGAGPAVQTPEKEPC